MASITQYVEQRLKLRVNREKSVVARALRRPFLGFCLRPRMGEGQGTRGHQSPQEGQGPPARSHLAALGRLDGAADHRDQPLHGRWTAYFRLADTPTPFDDLDEWLRRRLRQVRWKEWKRPRTRRRNLRARNISAATARQWASSRKGVLAHRRVQSPCRHPAQRLLGPARPAGDSRPLSPVSGMLSEPPDADSARPVVWGAPR